MLRDDPQLDGIVSNDSGLLRLRPNPNCSVINNIINSISIIYLFIQEIPRSCFCSDQGGGCQMMVKRSDVEQLLRAGKVCCTCVAFEALFLLEIHFQDFFDSTQEAFECQRQVVQVNTPRTDVVGGGF